MKDMSGDEVFLFSEESDEEDAIEWQNLSNDKMVDCMKYLSLLKNFRLDRNSISHRQKVWMFNNCDLPTQLVPEGFLAILDL
jgi:hypothetical protein